MIKGLRSRLYGPVLAGLLAATGWAGSAASAPPPARGTTVDVEGGKLYYESCGAGTQAIVLLHDGILSSVAWDDVWPILCRDFHVVRYDRRGYGRSPEAAAPYGQVDDLAAVM